MRASTLLTRGALPLLGIVALALTAWQVRGAGAEPGGPASASAAAPRPADAGLRVRAEARLVARPGAEVTLSADLPAVVDAVLVDEGDRVRRGQVIARLRADEERAALAETRARIAEADADIRLQRAELGRVQRLFEARVLPAQQLDRARHALEAADARRAVAASAARRLEATLAKAQVVAPIDGVVTARMVQAGERVDVGTPVAAVADLARTRIEAEVDEYDAGRVAVGAAVRVTAEGYDGRSWTGRVEEIPDVVTGRRLRPQDPGRPSDTRVLLVKVSLDGPAPFKLGQRVEVEITPRAAP